VSDFLRHDSVQARLLAACFMFFVLLSPVAASAQGTSVLTLLDTDGRELEMGDEVRGALSASDFITADDNYVEAWAFEGSPGQEVSIDLVSDDFDSYLYVVGPGLGETLADDDSGGACHSRINFTVLDRGVFHVVASSTMSRQTGTYRLRASREARPVVELSCGGLDGLELAALPTDGRELAWSVPAQGRLLGTEATLADGKPVQAWALEALAGETATIRLESEDFDAYLFAYGPGMMESLTDDDSGGGLNSELTVWFPETGTYTIGAGALSSPSSGSYTLSVSDPIDMSGLSTDGRSLRIGSNAKGILTGVDAVIEGQPVQAWALEARAGDFLIIDLISDDFDSYLFVVGPGLAEPLFDDDGGDGLNSRLSVSFPDDGVYNVIASSLGGELGAFTLQVR
jgi:hypothetical protein